MAIAASWDPVARPINKGITKSNSHMGIPMLTKLTAKPLMRPLTDKSSLKSITPATAKASCRRSPGKNIVLIR